MRTTGRSAAGAMILLASGLAGCRGAPPSTAQQAAESTLHGVVPPSSVARPHFTLMDTSGAAYDFYSRTAGRPTLLFWGYTHCADTCPATLHSIALALRRVPASVRSAVTVVFATSDPRRDTPEVVRRWLAGIDASFVGLTGSVAAVHAAEDASGVPRAMAETTSATGYDVEHYAGTTAYDRKDTLAVRYPVEAGARDYAADLPVLAREG